MPVSSAAIAVIRKRRKIARREDCATEPSFEKTSWLTSKDTKMSMGARGNHDWKLSFEELERFCLKGGYRIRKLRQLGPLFSSLAKIHESRIDLDP
jgi:hypothetical protein